VKFQKSFAVSISLQSKPHQQIVFSVRDIKISPKSREIEPKFVKMATLVKQSGYSFSLEVTWLYISAQKLESGRSKSFTLSI